NMMNLIPENSTVIAENNLPDPIPELLTRYHIIQSDQINITMPQYAIASHSSWWFTKFYGSGDYGILSEVSGVVLLEKNYTGIPIYYIPFNEHFNANQLHPGSSSKKANGTIYATNISSWQTIWYGPYATLPPGTFNITFQLETSNNSISNELMLYCSNITGRAVLSPIYITGSDFPVTNRWENIAEGRKNC
ncbi:MAG: hypothetical protein QW591_03160, partial [Candidatus Micrarchaeaceae archaeon]